MQTFAQISLRVTPEELADFKRAFEHWVPTRIAQTLQRQRTLTHTFFARECFLREIKRYLKENVDVKPANGGAP